MGAVNKIMIVTPATVYDEYCDYSIELAIIHLSLDEFKRIKHLQEIIRKENVFKIADFECIEFYDQRPLIPIDKLKNMLFTDEGDRAPFNYLNYSDEVKEDYTECDFCLECDQINIFQDSFRYTAYLKHTSIEVASNLLRVEDIEAAFNGKIKLKGAADYYDAKHITFEKVPLYIKSDKPNEKFYATELLKKTL